MSLRDAVADAIRTTALAVLLPLCFAPLGFADETVHSYVFSSDEKKIYDDELMGLIKQHLGGQYENLQIVVSSCYGGGFATEAKSGRNSLTGKWSVSTPRDQESTNKITVRSDQNLNGREGLLLQTKYLHGWNAQWIKSLILNPAYTAQQCFDYAEANDYNHDATPDPNPQFESGGGGSTSGIRDGTESNHALVWATINTNAHRWTMDKLNRMLTARGYSKSTIDFAFDKKRKGTRLGGIPMDREHATKANLVQMLKDLRTALDEHPGKEKAFLYINGHGNTGRRKAEKKPAAVPGQSKQGASYSPGQGPTITTPSSFESAFFEDVTIHDPESTRVAPPSFAVTTSEENGTGPTQVNLDGIPIGSFVLLGLSDGGHYRFPISDTVLTTLHQGSVMTDGQVDVTFHFGSGSFRVATEWDADLEGLAHYGVELTGPPIVAATTVGGSEEPGTGAGNRNRRRKRHFSSDPADR